MKDTKIKDNLIKIKTYFAALSKGTKRAIVIIAIVLVLAAIFAAVALNVAKGHYKPLYTELSTSEAGSIFQALKEMGADAKVSSTGDVMVPTDEYDLWIMQLAAKGYPKTALPYDVFSSHAGMTATESEKKQWLLFQLQDRIQATLERLDNVGSATVTLTIPETGDNVWDVATDEELPTAGVLLTLNQGAEMTPEQVHAIQVLIAASVPKMRPEDVTVIDSLTGLALSSTATDANGGTGQNMAFELMVQKQIEDNVVRLLSKRYGANGVVAVAKVTIDYDKMMTEKKELQPDENGDPFVTHNDGEYNINGVTQAGGLVGENDNTDVPQYGYTDPNGDEGMTNYRYSNDYDYSYIKTQIESGNAKLKRATISVMVDESALTPNRRDELIGLVSGSTDIPADLITISAFDKAAIDAPEPTPPEEPGLPDFLNLPTWVYIVAGICLLALIILILVVVVIVKKAKKAKILAQEEEEERQRAEDEARQQKEIDKYKRSLEDMAKSNVDPKDQAIVDEVRNFAKTNPQITANLLRSWMKEE